MERIPNLFEMCIYLVSSTYSSRYNIHAGVVSLFRVFLRISPGNGKPCLISFQYYLLLY